MTTKHQQTQPRRTYAEAQREGNIRHLARRSGATWLQGLDGFAISEQDLAKLLDERDELLAAALRTVRSSAVLPYAVENVLRDAIANATK